MNCYRPPPVHPAVLDLQRVPTIPAMLSPVPVEWSPAPIVTVSMSKSAQAALVKYGRLSVMLPSLKSQSDSYSQLPVTV
ncbi:hypothetical protein Tco_0507251 [Tanacetum coccineum]